MKSVLRGGVLYVVAAIVLIGVAVWYVSSGSVSDEVAKGRELRARKVVAQNDVKKDAPRQRANRVRKGRLGNKVKEAKPAVKPNFLSDIDEEEKLTAEMKRLFREIQDALDRDDRKGVFALVRKLQQMDEWPDGIPQSVKVKALGALAWFGASGMAEAVGFLADSDPEIQQTTLERFEEMLSDWDIGDTGASEIIKQVVKVVHDRDALDSFFMELDNMRPTVKAETALAIYDSENPEAVAVLEDNREFLFDGNAGDLEGREFFEQALKDAEQYYRENPEQAEEDRKFYGPQK